MEEIINALRATNLEHAFRSAFDDAERMLYGTEQGGWQSDTTAYAVMFNYETQEVFFLPYAIRGNGWAEIATQQNPWTLLGYVSGLSVCDGTATEYLVECLQAY